MRTIRLFTIAGFATLAALAAVAAAQTPDAVPTPRIAVRDTGAAATEDPAITKQAQQWWQALTTGTVDRSRLTPAMQRALTPIVLSESKKEFQALGAPVSWTFEDKEDVSGATAYRYRVAFPHGKVLNVTMALAPDGKLAGYVARPD